MASISAGIKQILYRRKEREKPPNIVHIYTKIESKRLKIFANIKIYLFIMPCFTTFVNHRKRIINKRT